jgi:hypothetical protein
MEVLLPFVFFVVVAALIGAVAYAQWQGEKKRTAALAALAERLRCRFEPVADTGIVGAASAFHLFDQGRSRAVKNLLSARHDELDVRLFDYFFVTGSGKSTKRWSQSVAHLTWPALRLPAFELRPEHFFHKIGSAFGYQDIDFPQHPEFSRLFLLRGADEAAIRQTFGVVVLDFFQRHPGVSAEGNGDTLVYYVADKRFRPEELEAFLRDAVDLAHRFPRTS